MRTSAAMPRRKKPQASAVIVLRKYRRLRRRRRRSLRHEYHKLRSLLPGAPRSPQLRRKVRERNADESYGIKEGSEASRCNAAVGVVDAAYQYICHLQSALLAKFSTRGVPADLAGVVGGKVSSASDVRALAIHLIHSTNMAPSFMTPPSASRGLSPFRHTSGASSASTSSISSRISTTQYLTRKSSSEK